VGLKQIVRWPSNRRRIILGAIVLAVVLVIVISLIVLYAPVKPAEATLVGAIIALFSVLIAQFVSIQIARSSQMQQQEMEDQRAQDDALQKYLDQISELLVDKRIRESGPEDDKRAVARAKTLTLLLRLDGTRKSVLLRFFHEARLIKKKATDNNQYIHPLIELKYADLSRAKLAHIDLRDDDLSDAYMDDADLTDARLEGASLKRVSLQRARLPGASLRGADLTGSSLRNADLRGATLREAILSGAVVVGANLSDTNLRDADLSDASMSEVNLDRADLRGAKGLPNEGIEGQR
jgi:uncharacterized protein YjbI with pentapeptide repeats